MSDNIFSVRRTQYRMYDIQTRVTGLTPPFICGFTLTSLNVPDAVPLVRMCVGRHSSLEDAHAVAQLVGEKTVDLMLAQPHRISWMESRPEPA